jgi:hypothetical protein
VPGKDNKIEQLNISTSDGKEYSPRSVGESKRTLTLFPSSDITACVSTGGFGGALKLRILSE